MTLHILKLAVGIETLSGLVARQEKRLAEMKRAKQKPELIHITRNRPKRAAEVLEGGSLYWIVKGWIVARQKLLELRPVTRDGIACCAMVYDRSLIPVALRPHRAFQGWRYLEGKGAPPDIAKSGHGADLPEELRRELVALGLL
jgi:hypothetical protein